MKTLTLALNESWLHAKVHALTAKRQEDSEAFRAECQVEVDAKTLDGARIQAERVAIHYSEQLWNQVVYALKGHAGSLKRLTQHLKTLMEGKTPDWAPYEITLFGVDEPTEPPYVWIAKWVKHQQRCAELSSYSIKACERFQAECQQGI